MPLNEAITKKTQKDYFAKTAMKDRCLTPDFDFSSQTHTQS
ncbi:hypothetical protein DFO77_11366 [Marinilabilia salmonicolor]|uniref:Uncharacterized protein n=1 Tax=Marinilabilia salmonicolor TaxID=989 RepID=A0A368V2T3_9BACT|nr:hypothetical protein DFO77_11366 [Marinilabilia salmonicolor]